MTTHQVDFTNHIMTCEGCDEKFRINKDFLTFAQDESVRFTGETITEEEAAEGCQFCLECVSGEIHEDEKSEIGDGQ